MKCVQNQINGKIVRVSDKDAEKLVNNLKGKPNSRWQFCPKHLWKKQVRDVDEEKKLEIKDGSNSSN